MLAFDFDGVIADGVDECLLVSWIARHDLGLDAFSPGGLDSVPNSFRDEFSRLRRFVRHDGHFLVPFIGDTKDIDDAIAFGQRYDSIPESEREGFREKFVAIRTAARKADEGYWFSLHRTFPEVVRTIALLRGDIQIVSGKDGLSIIEILRNQDIHVDDAAVFGRLTSKRGVLTELLEVARGRGEELVFVDDNLANVIEAIQLGARGLWATWGHHSDDDVIRAKRENVPIVTLESIGSLLGELTHGVHGMRFLHTMIRVSDIEDSLAFYCEALGLVEVRRTESQAGKFTLIFLAAPGDTDAAYERAPLLELTYNWEPEVYTGGRNFGHVAFEVPDIYVRCQSLLDHGVEIRRPPRDGKMAFVRSPDGISIELLQAGAPLPPAEPWQSMPNSGTW
ncbi:VOC family protein [Gluconacetobacter sacchari]|uniref:VOC family protein n=1 Tax=Gluconacetobacter sacchari TaxID=92759 RepID=UPI0039B4B2FD